MKKIVTLGEILLRLSAKVGVRLEQSDHLLVNYGGAEANVSASLAHLGMDVYFVSKVPNNAVGRGVERHLKANGVRTDYLIKNGDRLGTYYIEPGVGGRGTQVTYDRKHSSFSQMKLDEIDFDAIFEGASLFHVTGITPALSTSLKEITTYSLRKAKEMGILTSLDFNYRSKLWSQEDAAATLKPLLPYVDVCSCGELDALHILGIPEAARDMNQSEKLDYYYKSIQAQYPNITYFCSTFREVLSASTNTLQGNFYMEGELHQSKIFHIDHMVDRVGGGDAFAAGILYGLLTDMSPEQVVSFATAASALKHTVYGDVNPFSKEEITAFAEQKSGEVNR
ncbi:2-dehydro-3-deoxygluconokinase [Lederbergia ruris]|uniref:2-dehydro-3-deoxygluconokinase n=1 Tax=Lederbergia ruris TaxID=217495 RepID=A0ABQ4KDD9_9BACI|nr:sugar kinase [Lederbergia ruris]GIN55983.1 2-dehydro-3-deoxygluconokinase [Lederbergia ruris]